MVDTESSLKRWEVSYILSSLVTNSPQKGGRHAVTNCERFKRTGIETSGLSKSLQILQNLCKPFYFKSFPSSSSLCLLETRSIQQRQGYFSNVLYSQKGICFSPILFNRQSLTQSFERSNHVSFGNTSMINPVLVPSVTKALDSKPLDLAQSPRFVTRSKQGTSSPSNKRKPASPGMDSFRERLSSEGI